MHQQPAFGLNTSAEVSVVLLLFFPAAVPYPTTSKHPKLWCNLKYCLWTVTPRVFVFRGRQIRLLGLWDGHFLFIHRQGHDLSGLLACCQLFVDINSEAPCTEMDNAQWVFNWGSCGVFFIRFFFKLAYVHVGANMHVGLFSSWIGWGMLFVVKWGLSNCS